MAAAHLLLLLFVSSFTNRSMNDCTENTRPCKMQRTSNDHERTLAAIEFYCGVGGWSMALDAAVAQLGVSVRCVAALDHSDLCTKTYQHNKRTEDANPTTKNIEKLTLKTVENWNAAIWAMSPPCQPHTRQHSNQEADLEDPRSKSFLHICRLIDTMAEDKLPRLILIENVVGFEASKSCFRLRQVLSKRKYSVGHFHLSPTQVGIPNDRPRYFGVAVRLEEAQIEENTSSLRNHLQHESGNQWEEPCKIQTHLEDLKVLPPLSGEETSSPVPAISSFLDLNENTNLNLRIPEKILTSNAAWCFDIVTPHDNRSSCFTQAYGKFVKGTGSVLYFGGQNDSNGEDNTFKLVPPEEREFNKDWTKGLDLKHNLRYLSGEEVARLFDFKEGFAFPEDVSQKQQWKLLGNSLNVRVASRMCELGLRLIL